MELIANSEVDRFDIWFTLCLSEKPFCLFDQWNKLVSKMVKIVGGMVELKSSHIPIDPGNLNYVSEGQYVMVK